MFAFSLTFAAENTVEKAERLEMYIEKMASGNKSALAEFYENTKTTVYGYTLSILKNVSEAEDVLQETYIHIFAAAASYCPQGKPVAWTLKIAKNLSLMRLREQKKSPEVAWEDWERSFGENERLSYEDKLILRTAMSTLGDEERQIVVLKAVSGLRHRELAEILSLPLSTVLSRYSRALKKLEMLLREE